MMRGERLVKTGSADRWGLDPGENLLAVARVTPPGRFEAQSGGNGFDLALTDRRLLVSKRRAVRNKDRTSIVQEIPLNSITAARTEKRHPAATFGIPLYRLDLVLGSLDNTFSCEAGSFAIRHLETLANALIAQRPDLKTAPWPDFSTLQSAVAGEPTEEERNAIDKAKRRLVIAIVVLVAVTTGGIVLWRSEDHPGASFTLATIVLLVALQILFYVWQLWEGIRKKTRPAQPVDQSAPMDMDLVYAGFGRRALGFLIDVVAIVIVLYAVIAVVLLLAHPVFGADVNISSNSQLGANLFIPGVPITFFVYPFVLITRSGRTLGMRFMKLRLFALTAERSVVPAGGWKVAGRTAISLFFLCALLCSLIDYLWALGSRRHQCLHDKWSGTIALDVRNGPPRPASAPARTEALETVSGD